MTETTESAVSATEPTSISSKIVSEPKLYAGKYKTVEDLEKAYGNSVTAIVEKSKLEKELESYKAPEDYTVPDGLSFREEDIQEVKHIAKTAEMSQKQFEKTITEMHSKVTENVEAQKRFIEDRKKSIGDEKINLLTDYVDKYYPSSVKDVVLNKLLKDESAMNDALKDREARLNTQAPGVGRGAPTGGEQYDGQKELRDVAKQYEREPHNRELREKMISLARDVGHARFEKR